MNIALQRNYDVRIAGYSYEIDINNAEPGNAGYYPYICLIPGHADMLGMKGFIGATTGVIGDRMITISAWDDADAPRQVMSHGAHAEAMKGMLSGEVATGGFTSVYTLERMNPYLLRCETCGKMNRGVEAGDDCKHCGATLPPREPYW